MRFYLLNLAVILLAGCPVVLAAHVPGNLDDGKAATAIEEKQLPPPPPVNGDEYDVESGTGTNENSGDSGGEEVLVRKINVQRGDSYGAIARGFPAAAEALRKEDRREEDASLSQVGQGMHGVSHEHRCHVQIADVLPAGGG